MVPWLKDAIFYQIYPTSFYDGNGDGIGDLIGIIGKLDYLQGLGVNAIWLNPIYPSPFQDGGYDVTDHYSIHPSFGTMADFEKLIEECTRRGLRVVIDLVIGHTSDKHPWFLSSAREERSAYSDYYIWTDSVFNKYKDKTVHGLYPRDGGYYINYYACQPALNYGFNSMDDKKEPYEKDDGYSESAEWKMLYNDERLKPLREEIINLMRFWLKKGVSGFRVDLANSLVKGCDYQSDHDEDIAGNRWVWKEIMRPIRNEYPDCALIAEWVYAKNAVGKCGFDVDFYAHDIPEYNDLFRNEKGSNLLPSFEKGDSYFSPNGKGDIEKFIGYYLQDLAAIEGKGYVSVPTGSHDQIRISYHRNEEDLKVVFAFLLTLKHVPFLYYGDEIGLSHVHGLNRDGGYVRTGARTPMQWNEDRNRGFSPAEETYLPVNDEKEQSVSVQERRADSLLSTVRSLIALRKKYSCLNADGGIEFVRSQKGSPLIFRRRDRAAQLTVILNPAAKEQTVETEGRLLCASGAYKSGNTLTFTGTGFAILSDRE